MLKKILNNFGLTMYEKFLDRFEDDPEKRKDIAFYAVDDGKYCADESDQKEFFKLALELVEDDVDAKKDIATIIMQEPCDYDLCSDFIDFHIPEAKEMLGKRYLGAARRCKKLEDKLVRYEKSKDFLWEFDLSDGAHDLADMAAEAKDFDKKMDLYQKALDYDDDKDTRLSIAYSMIDEGEMMKSTKKKVMLYHAAIDGIWDSKKDRQKVGKRILKEAKKTRSKHKKQELKIIASYYLMD